MLGTHSSTAPGYGGAPSLAPMQFGLALPQYDYSVAGEPELAYATIVDHARTAAGAGAASVWLSDHLFLDLGGDVVLVEPGHRGSPIGTSR